MANITDTARQAARVRPAQAGRGTVTHYMQAGHRSTALCGRIVTPLNDVAAAAMIRDCARCAKAVKQLAADDTPTPAPVAPRHIATYETVQVDGDFVDRITVEVTGQTAPVLVAEIPYDRDGDTRSNLAALGWTVTAMDAYAGPTHFRAVVELSNPTPAAPDDRDALATKLAALSTAYVSCTNVRAVRPVTDPATGAALGWTFCTGYYAALRYRYVTAAGALDGHGNGFDSRPAAERALRDPHPEDTADAYPLIAAHVQALTTEEITARLEETDPERIRTARDGLRKTTVHRGGDYLGCVWDNGHSKGGRRYSAFPVHATYVSSPESKHADVESAVVVVVATWPVLAAEIAGETGRPLDDVLDAADALHAELEATGGHAIVQLGSLGGGLTRITQAAAATLRERLAAQA